MNFLRIYENTYNKFLEASKERFLTKNWDIFQAAGAKDFQPLLTYVNSQAFENKAKEKNINWQTLDNDDILFILKSFDDYNNAGGSRSSRKAAKKVDPIKVFTDNGKGLKTVHEGENVTGADFCILDSLENDEWIFVVPLTWEACKYADSSNCGGQGAKWCIGYEKVKSYYDDYIMGDGAWFVLAFSKNPNPLENKLKYMLQLGAGRSTAWSQEDYKYDFWVQDFGDDENFLEAFKNAILSESAGESIYKEAAQQFISTNPMVTDYLTIEHKLRLYYEGKCPAIKDTEFDYVILSSLCDDNYLVLAPLSEKGIKALAKATYSAWQIEHNEFKDYALDCYSFVFILQKMTGKCFLVGVNPIKETFVWNKKGENVPQELNKMGFNHKQLWQTMRNAALTGKVPRSIFMEIYNRYGNQLEDSEFFMNAYEFLPSYIEQVNINGNGTEFYSTKHITEDELKEILNSCFKAGYYIEYFEYDEQPLTDGKFKYLTESVPIKFKRFDGLKGAKCVVDAYQAVVDGAFWIFAKFDNTVDISNKRRIAEVLIDQDISTSPGLIARCEYNDYFVIKTRS